MPDRQIITVALIKDIPRHFVLHVKYLALAFLATWSVSIIPCLSTCSCARPNVGYN